MITYEEEDVQDLDSIHKILDKYGKPETILSSEFYSGECSYVGEQPLWNKGQLYSILIPGNSEFLKFNSDGNISVIDDTVRDEMPLRMLVAFLSKRLVEREELLAETDKNINEEMARAKDNVKAREEVKSKALAVIKKYKFPNLFENLCPDE